MFQEFSRKGFSNPPNHTNSTEKVINELGEKIVEKVCITLQTHLTL